MLNLFFWSITLGILIGHIPAVRCNLSLRKTALVQHKQLRIAITGFPLPSGLNEKP
jgi:hypothetical protein